MGGVLFGSNPFTQPTTKPPTYTNPYPSIMPPQPYQPPTTLPPVQQNYQLPPPPPLPTIPQYSSSFLPQLQALIGQFKTLQPFGQLSPDILALLGQQKTAATSSANLAFRDAFDKALADLYGRGVERSTIATDAEGRLATEKANTMAQIEADAASRQLAAQQYAGQFGSQNLAQLANIIGSGASLEQNAYNTDVNAILQRAGLANQQYATQTGNTLGQQGLALNQQQLQQQYALQQQQMLQQLLTGFLSGQFQIPGTGGGGSSFGGFGTGGTGTSGSGTNFYSGPATWQYGGGGINQGSTTQNSYYTFIDSLYYSLTGQHLPKP